MKAEPNTAIKELRRIIGRTQAEFANLIGVSKDAVVNWENGRNRISRDLAMRIQFVTGASAQDLLANRTLTFFGMNAPYSAADWERHCSDPESPNDTFADAIILDLKLLLEAAKTSGRGKLKHRLPGVVHSFMQWALQTMQDFHLEPDLLKLIPELQLPSSAPIFLCTLDPELWRKCHRLDKSQLIMRVPRSDLLAEYRKKQKATSGKRESGVSEL